MPSAPTLSQNLILEKDGFETCGSLKGKGGLEFKQAAPLGPSLDTMLDLLDAPDYEPIHIDGSVPPSFEECRPKGMKTAWFTDLVSTDRQNTPVWPATITHEFMYKLLWKKLPVRQRVGPVMDFHEGSVWYR